MIAIDMITKAHLSHYDTAILIGGDADLCPIVKAVKDNTGKKVYGVYFENHIDDGLFKLFDRSVNLPRGIAKKFSEIHEPKLD
jgi:uncharacterized LabA/DUF88 family protein